MGTFDILNLRMNGYDFHVDLMAGKQKWTDPKVTAVFKKWAEILPFHAKDYAGLTWPDAATTLLQQEVRDVPARAVHVERSSRRPRSRKTSPTSTSSRSRRSAPSTTPRSRSDAPIDTWQIAAKSPNLADGDGRRQGLSRVLVEGLDAGDHVQDGQPGFIPTANDADTSTYSDLQKKAVEVVGSAKRITQFLDRDTRSDFAGAKGMQSFLQTFLKNPNAGPGRLQTSIQAFWDALPPL